MADTNTQDLTSIGQLKKLALRSKSAADAASAIAAKGIKSVKYENNTLSFYTSEDMSGTAVATANLPEEMFLNQANTKFVEKFAWTEATYPGSTNPNLEGKPVMVLAVHGDDGDTYSFLNVEKLMNVYTAGTGDGSAAVVIDGYTIKVNVNISAEAGNALVKKADGLYVPAVDVTGKADKDTDAVEGHIAKFDANGNPVDSGAKMATDAEVDAMLEEVFGPAV